MVKITYHNYYEKKPENAVENQNVISENRSGEISEVELPLILHEGKAEKKSSDDPRSDAPSSLDETVYLSHHDENVSKAESPSASDQSHYRLPTNQQKQIFFEILKDLLKNPLVDGDKGVYQSGENFLELIYMNKKCELRILNSDRICQWKQKLKTGDIYLKWRGNHVEHLNPENLQNVQNELESLGIQNNRIQSCFSLARTNFMEEPSFIQKNMKLAIICDKIIIAFSEGEGENVAKVLYDDNLSSPRYFMKVKNWWKTIGRYFFIYLPSMIESLPTLIVNMLFQKLTGNSKLKFL